MKNGFGGSEMEVKELLSQYENVSVLVAIAVNEDG